MRKLICLIAGGLMMASGPASASSPQGEEELERALAGRVAGQPVQCITTFQSSSSRIIDRTAIIFRVGSTLYVNRPRSGAESLDRSDALFSRRFGPASRLCSDETMRVIDPNSGIMNGIVFLGDFVPYRRASSRY